MKLKMKLVLLNKRSDKLTLFVLKNLNRALAVRPTITLLKKNLFSSSE